MFEKIFGSSYGIIYNVFKIRGIEVNWQIATAVIHLIAIIAVTTIIVLLRKKEEKRYAVLVTILVIALVMFCKKISFM